MKYTFEIYKASLGTVPKGYVYARSPDEAEAVWKTLAGIQAYYNIQDTTELRHEYPADRFELMEDAEFYQASDEEGGFVIMLAPDELSDRIIETAHTHEPHVFYLVGLEDE